MLWCAVVQTQQDSFVPGAFVAVHSPISVKWSGLNEDPVKLVTCDPHASASRAIVDLDATAIGWLEFDVANGTIHDACLRRSREGRCRHQIGSVGKRDDSTNLNLISQDWQVRCLHYCVLGDLFGVESVSVALQNEALAASEQMQVVNSAVQLDFHVDLDLLDSGNIILIDMIRDYCAIHGGTSQVVAKKLSGC
jgi:hypothetical protein